MSPVFRALQRLSISLVCALSSIAQTTTINFLNFESPLTNPIRLSADGSKLFCVNNPNGSVSVFDISSPTKPKLTAEITVGIGPVSVNVNPQNSDELWVVNQVSNSVSVVSISRKLVTDTIAAKAEPADVVFAGNNAFVSISRSNLVNVYSLSNHALVKSISVFGGSPRAMTVSADQSTVYAVFTISGNQTTTIPANKAIQPAQPPNLPPIPLQADITLWNSPTYQQIIKYTMPDNDVVAISASSLTISKYFNAVGTINFGIAIQPSTQNLFVANTDSTNLTRLQPNLCAHFVSNRISKITQSNQVTAYDLNPGVSTACSIDTTSLSTALAQPTALVFDGSGQHMYVAAFGTDRIGKVDTNGNVLARIDVNPSETGTVAAPGTKRGPRGLAINNATNKLYVMNRISNTFSIIDTASNTVVAYDIKTGTKDPTPSAVLQGRGFLYDAKLSGNGTVACASCHIDGETDHLAWDLGDPNGPLVTVTLSTGATAQLSPMKGPMTTLTLRGLVNTAPYHWRGDKPTLNDFNEAFQQLMGGNQLSDSDMQTYVNFLNTISYLPNPNQNLDRTYPTNLSGGNAQNGENLYLTLPASSKGETCASCHSLVNGTIGSNLAIQPTQPQPLKVPQLRAVYQKLLFSGISQTIDGVGLDDDGSIPGLLSFLSQLSAFPGLAGRTSDKSDIGAFVASLDTGVAPTVGYSRTLLSSNVTSSSIVSDWSTLESQAAAGNCGLVAAGTIKGVLTNLGYAPSSQTYFVQNGGGVAYTHAQLVSLVQNGDTLTIMGMPD